jgi:membrane protein DedA with SNARE-associated domain
VLSATINPLFYPAALAAGALRFKLWKFTVICLAGKIIKGMAVAFAGYYGLRQVLHWFGIQV